MKVFYGCLRGWGFYWEERNGGFRDGGTLADWTPQVLPPACVSATPRSAAQDAAFPGPAATPAPATLASGSAPRAPDALVSKAEGVEGGGAGVFALSPAPSVSSDVDECRRVPPPCAPGRCENSPGSFRCVCGPGFRAGPRAAECLGEKFAPPGSRPTPGSRSCSHSRASPPLPRFPCRVPPQDRSSLVLGPALPCPASTQLQPPFDPTPT